MNRLLGRAGRVAAVAVALGAVTAASPVAATDRVGGGTLAGTLKYSRGSLPTVSGTCGQVSWGMQAFSASIVVDAATPFAGPVTVTAEAQTVPGFCESFAVGSGWGTVAIRGTSPTGATLACTSGPDTGVYATYGRWATNLALFASVACAVDGTPIGVLNLNGDIELVPTTPGGGVTVSVTEATVAGAFALTN